MFLQSYVVPVCLYETEQGKANIKELFGTAFFINGHGIFVTAGHVIQNAESAAREKKLKLGLVVKLDEGKSSQSAISQIHSREFAPKPFDIAMGKTEYNCRTHLKLEEIDIAEWQDVATFGYPINAVSGDPNALNLNIRCHKGYIQRTTKPGDVPLGEHPVGFELSFVLSSGVSGAPLFVHRGSHDIVIGVCVGSIRSEVVEDTHEDIDDDGKIYRETRLKIDQYGLAHDLRPLFDWTPPGFDSSLLKLSRA